MPYKEIIMSIACEKCVQRERIIGELEDENKRLGAKIVILKNELEVLNVTVRANYSNLSEAME